MKRLRLFWLMVIAFALAILLALCGMLGFIGLSFSGSVPSTSFRVGLREAADSYAVILGDYYAANDQSWSGVERRLAAPPFTGQGNFYSYVLLDQQGDVLASTDSMHTEALLPGDEFNQSGLPAMPIAPDPPRLSNRRTPMRGPSEQADIMIHGQHIGALIVRPDFGFQDRGSDAPFNTRPDSFLWGVWRSFAIAGVGFGGLLIGLAVLFARRLTRPLRGLTKASEALAAGRLDTRVPGVRIRELDELATAFNRMAERLSSADAQRRQMTADIAHELRTPLSIIRGRLEGLQDGVYQATPEHVGGLLHETAMLERLVDDLRLLALAEAGQLPLYRESSDPHALLEGAVHAFTDQAHTQSIQFQIEAPAELPEVDVDPQRISQVLKNLLSNALRYTPIGGVVTLRAAIDPAAESTLILSVQDSGPGIEPDDLPHLFDRFWRANRSRTRGSGGSGLGLAIVKQIVEAHGGHVAVNSTIGQGTTFSIHLPIVRDEH